MKINWFSNAAHCATGYGNQTKLFTPRIKALGHDVTITAFFGLDGAPIVNPDGIFTYPKAHHLYGMDIIDAHATNAKADIIISLLDIWVCDPGHIHHPWYPWFPVDCEPIPGRVRDIVPYATKGITMSKFGQRMAEMAGLDTYYIPHGVDTKAFSPSDRSRGRAALGLPIDAFVVGMVAANKGNPPRKSFFEQIAAFAVLKTRHSDAVLYLHTDNGLQGGETVNLDEYCRVMGLTPGKDVFFCDQYAYTLGFNDEYMCHAYNSMDVLMLASMGEGFGIPLIEAQACGVPVITGEWTAMGELCFSGWKIPKSEAIPTWSPFFGAFQWRVTTEAVYARLEAAYEVRNNQEYRDRARAGALRYDADRVTKKYWKPTLEDIESTLVPQLAKEIA